MRPLKALIDLRALDANLSLARKLAGTESLPGIRPTRLVAVIKANAYGHGLVRIGSHLEGKADMLAVASMEEAMQLREAGVTSCVLLLAGPFEATEMEVAEKQGFTLVLHQPHQLAWLERFPVGCDYWLKLETGMHRMGLDQPDLAQLVQSANQRGVKPVLMHHYACADTSEHPLNQVQSQAFKRLTKGLNTPHSCANSAALCAQRLPLGEYIRPGLMLYGASPLAGVSAASLGLAPVMRLESELISCKPVTAGETVGYGADFIAPSDGHVGLVACGYGDGYPREFKQDTKPWVKVGDRQALIAGRVSMDSLAVWLGNKPQPPGARVVLWGEEPTINQVAAWAGTIAYSLFTRLAQRVTRVYNS